MDIWKLSIGHDSLRYKRKDDNIHDKNAVAVIHSYHIAPRVVGHVPFLYSSTFKKFLSLQIHTIKVLVTGKRIYRGAGYDLDRNRNFLLNMYLKVH